MKLSDQPPKVIDAVISEVRAIKRGIAERYGNDIDRLLDALIDRERTAGTSETEAGAGQPAPHHKSVSEGGDKPQPESEEPFR